MEAAKESFAQRHSVNYQLSIINCQLIKRGQRDPLPPQAQPLRELKTEERGDHTP